MSISKPSSPLAWPSWDSHHHLSLWTVISQPSLLQSPASSPSLQPLPASCSPYFQGMSPTTHPHAWSLGRRLPLPLSSSPHDSADVCQPSPLLGSTPPGPTLPCTPKVQSHPFPNTPLPPAPDSAALREAAPKECPSTPGECYPPEIPQLGRRRL